MQKLRKEELSKIDKGVEDIKLNLSKRKNIYDTWKKKKDQLNTLKVELIKKETLNKFDKVEIEMLDDKFIKYKELLIEITILKNEFDSLHKGG